MDLLDDDILCVLEIEASSSDNPFVAHPDDRLVRTNVQRIGGGFVIGYFDGICTFTSIAIRAPREVSHMALLRMVADHTN